LRGLSAIAELLVSNNCCFRFMCCKLVAVKFDLNQVKNLR